MRHEMDPSEIIMQSGKSPLRRTVTERSSEREEVSVREGTALCDKPPRQILCESHGPWGLVVRYPTEFPDPCRPLSMTCSRIHVKCARSQKLFCEIVK